MKEQIQADKFHIIDISDFEHEVKRLSDKNPDIRNFLAKIKELDPRLHSTKYLNKFTDSEEFRKRYNEALAKLRLRVRGEPSQRAKNALMAIIESEYLESFSKQKLKTENAYEAELGREMTPEERRHLLYQNQSGLPQEAIRIIQPPPIFIEQYQRDMARLDELTQNLRRALDNRTNREATQQQRAEAEEYQRVRRELQQRYADYQPILRERMMRDREQQAQREQRRQNEGLLQDDDMEAGNPDYWNYRDF